MRNGKFLAVFLFILFNISLVSSIGEVIDLRSPIVINVNTGATGAADGNASSICSGDEVLLGNESCLSAATLVSGGGGDITAVNTAGNYLTGGAATGDVSLLFNESFANDTNDLRYTPILWAHNETLATLAILTGNCAGTDKVAGIMANGTINCTTDATGAGGGNPFDQTLNTTDAVIFAGLNITSYILSTDWTNVTITESQISDLTAHRGLFEVVNNWVTNDTTNGINTTSLIIQDQMLTPQNNFGINFYDDGSDVFLNVTNGGGDFSIEQDNTKLTLFNAPSAANDFKVFQVFSKEAADVSEFVITKAGPGHASFAIRSFSLPGNATDTPIPFNCTTYADFIDCETDTTGPDLFILDDIETKGSVYFGNGTINSTDDGNLSALFFVGDGSRLTNLPAGVFPADQDLNTTSSVSFVGVNMTGDLFSVDWSNVTITESQITDLVHTGGIFPADQDLNTTSNVTFDNINTTSGIHIPSGGILYVEEMKDVGGGISVDMVASGNALFDITNGGAGNASLTVSGVLTAEQQVRTDEIQTRGTISNLDVNVFRTDEDGVLNITNGDGTFDANLELDGDARVIGNITTTFILADGSQLTNLPVTGGNPFDQTLNTTDSVIFTGLNVSSNLFSVDWTNVTITESQITDLVHPAQVNPFDQTLNTTDGVSFTGLNVTSNLFSVDWSNVTITESQITDLVHTGGIFPADQDLNTTSSVIFVGLNITTDIFSVDWTNVTITESQVTDLVHTPLTNIAFLNNTQTFTGTNTFSTDTQFGDDINVTNNATINDRICFNPDCSSSMYHNGTGIIIG